MGKILIFGHKNPDTDSICSSIVMQYLQETINEESEAVRLGKINKETEYALNYFNVEKPIMIESIEEGQEVILVDHNEFAQSVNGIEKAKILKVFDHHRIDDFKTEQPLFYYSEPVGCTGTILYKIHKMNNLEVNPTMAGLMLSAIISDTLLFKSPTCTEIDKIIAKELAKIANVDINTYGLELLKAGTDLDDLSEKELINLDAKEFEKNGIKYEIAQINTVSIEDVLKRQEKLEQEINDEISKKGLDLFVFAITDILNSNSEIISLGNKAKIVEKAFGKELKDNRAFLEGVVSRKKQLLPEIDKTID